MLDRSELGPLLRPLVQSHVERGARIPAFEHRLGTGRIAMRDQLDGQIGVGNAFERRGDVGEQRAVRLAPAFGVEGVATEFWRITFDEPIA